MFVSEINEFADYRTEKNEEVGYHKHPVLQQPTVHGEAKGSRQLPDKQPLGNSPRGFVVPLFINLANNRGQQYQGT